MTGIGKCFLFLSGIILKYNIMTVVSTKEFSANQEKYLDMAVKEQVYIQREDYLFIVTRFKEPKKKKYLEPDDDLRRAITMDELRESVHAHIDTLFAEK